MSEANPENLTVKVAQLEKKLEATLTVIGKLVQALDYMRDGDARFIFEMDLVKHSLSEAGYTDSTSELQEPSSPSFQAK
jgi:regulator of replication initiation timing